MRHRKKRNKLSRNAAHREALLSNLSKQLIEHERIKTSQAKAKAVKPEVEQLITLAKRGDLHARRQALATLHNDKFIVHKLFEEVAPRYATRPGGYTRIVKLGPRRSDSHRDGVPRAGLVVSRPTRDTSSLRHRVLRFASGRDRIAAQGCAPTGSASNVDGARPRVDAELRACAGPGGAGDGVGGDPAGADRPARWPRRTDAEACTPAGGSAANAAKSRVPATWCAAAGVGPRDLAVDRRCPAPTGSMPARDASSRSYRYRLLTRRRGPLRARPRALVAHRVDRRRPRCLRRRPAGAPRLHRLHAHPDGPRPLRARSPALRGTRARRHPRLRVITGDDLHAQHGPDPGRDDARGRLQPPQRRGSGCCARPSRPGPSDGRAARAHRGVCSTCAGTARLESPVDAHSPHQ